MPFSNPWGLLALLGVPAVLALHKLRRRLRERRVAGLFLFAPSSLSEDAGRTLSPILRTASLLLEVTGAALLALLLAGPVMGSARPPAHLVVVLDDSASMGAVFEGRGIADEARSFVRGRIDDLDVDALVTILLTGRPPALLGGQRSRAGLARAALDRWLPVGAAHDRGPALDLALEFAGPADSILLVTDATDPEVPDRVEVAAFGRPLENVALSSARRFRSGEREVVTVDVIAYARAPAPTDVVVLEGEGGQAREIARKPVVVDPSRPFRLTLDVPASEASLRVALAADALGLDGTTVLLAERIRLVPFAVSMAAETASGLRLDRLARAVPGLSRVDPDAAALHFADTEGPARPGTTRVVVSAPGTERDDWLGPFLVDRAHGLVEGLTLEGVVWSAGRGTLPGRGLAFAGEQVLVSEEVAGGATVVRLNLDPARSTLPASADWPILLSNLVERARSSLPGSAAANARVGESLVYRTDEPESATAAWRFVAPSGAEEPALGRGVLAIEPKEAGVHRLVSPAGEVARWGVAFVDGAESDLRGRGSSRHPPRAIAKAGADSASSAGSPLAIRILSILLLAVVAADAWVLSQRLGRGRAAT